MLLSIGVVLLIVLSVHRVHWRRPTASRSPDHGGHGDDGFCRDLASLERSPLAAAALIAPFLFLDLVFLSANLLKVFEGGWVPLALGAW